VVQVIFNQSTNISENIIDGKELMEIVLANDPTKKFILIQNKTDLVKLLANRGYSEEHIRFVVENSRCK
jgi:hypothetical protein